MKNFISVRFLLLTTTLVLTTGLAPPAHALPTVTVAATDATATIGSASDTALLTFTRTGSTTTALTINYALGGTAVKWNDYYRLPQGDMPVAGGGRPPAGDDPQRRREHAVGDRVLVGVQAPPAERVEDGVVEGGRDREVPHLEAEQEVLYRRLETGKSEESRKFGIEGTSEHSLVEQQVEKLVRLSNPMSDEWTAELKVLQDLIEHHVGEEESTGFSCARDEFTKEQLEAMSQQFQARKAQLATRVA